MSQDTAMVGDWTPTIGNVPRFKVRRLIENVREINLLLLYQLCMIQYTGTVPFRLGEPFDFPFFVLVKSAYFETSENP